ncbi:adhesion G-protein coupled receptor G6 isoform X3 [Gouania willdenowi]|uniref:adhesion G-protein coupled receptor G6 isoform X3 n=1 Tax=Gouania willdenowi TaxID=441366 RepID=UPI0010563782|nr:adhesion G-protein coupled receptor G6 isoform X3 [Gouania willdenowi]
MESCSEGGGGGRWRLRVLLLVLMWVTTHKHVLGCSSTNCDVVRTDAQGEITSPCYPQNYPNSQTCRWSLQAPAGFIVQLSFLDFDLEEAPGCIYDRVVVNTGSADVKFCGLTANGLMLNSTGNVMELSFISDFSVQKRGFSVSFRHVAVALRNQKVKITSSGGGQVTEVADSVSIPALSHMTVCFEVQRISLKQSEEIFTYSDSSNNVALSLGSDQNEMKLMVDGIVCPMDKILSPSNITSSMKSFCVLWMSSSGRVEVYLDRQLKGQTCSESAGHFLPAAGNFQLGGQNSLNGNIYNVRLWDYAMSAQQLAALTCDTAGNIIDWDNGYWAIPSTLAQTDNTLSCSVSMANVTPLTSGCASPALGCPAAASTPASSTDSTNIIHHTNANAHVVSITPSSTTTTTTTTPPTSMPLTSPSSSSSSSSTSATSSSSLSSSSAQQTTSNSPPAPTNLRATNRAAHVTAEEMTPKSSSRPSVPRPALTASQTERPTTKLPHRHIRRYQGGLAAGSSDSLSNRRKPIRLTDPQTVAEEPVMYKSSVRLPGRIVLPVRHGPFSPPDSPFPQPPVFYQRPQTRRVLRTNLGFISTPLIKRRRRPATRRPTPRYEVYMTKPAVPPSLTESTTLTRHTPGSKNTSHLVHNLLHLLPDSSSRPQPGSTTSAQSSAGLGSSSSHLLSSVLGSRKNKPVGVPLGNWSHETQINESSSRFGAFANSPEDAAVNRTKVVTSVEEGGLNRSCLHEHSEDPQSSFESLRLELLQENLRPQTSVGLFSMSHQKAQICSDGHVAKEQSSLEAFVELQETNLQPSLSSHLMQSSWPRDSSTLSVLSFPSSLRVFPSTLLPVTESVLNSSVIQLSSDQSFSGADLLLNQHSAFEPTPALESLSLSKELPEPDKPDLEDVLLTEDLQVLSKTTSNYASNSLTDMKGNQSFQTQPGSSEVVFGDPRGGLEEMERKSSVALGFIPPTSNMAGSQFLSPLDKHSEAKLSSSSSSPISFFTLSPSIVTHKDSLSYSSPLFVDSFHLASHSLSSDVISSGHSHSMISQLPYPLDHLEYTSGSTQMVHSSTSVMLESFREPKRGWIPQKEEWLQRPVLSNLIPSHLFSLTLPVPPFGLVTDTGISFPSPTQPTSVISAQDKLPLLDVDQAVHSKMILVTGETSIPDDDLKSSLSENNTSTVWRLSLPSEVFDPADVIPKMHIVGELNSGEDSDGTKPLDVSSDPDSLGGPNSPKPLLPSAADVTPSPQTSTFPTSSSTNKNPAQVFYATNSKQAQSSSSPADDLTKSNSTISIPSVSNLGRNQSTTFRDKQGTTPPFNGHSRLFTTTNPSVIGSLSGPKTAALHPTSVAAARLCQCKQGFNYTCLCGLSSGNKSLFYRVSLVARDGRSTLVQEDVQEAVALWLNQTFQNWTHAVYMENISVQTGDDPTSFLCRALLVHYYITNESVGEPAVLAQLSSRVRFIGSDLQVPVSSLHVQQIENCPEDNPLHYRWPESRPTITQYLPCFPNKDQTSSRTCVINRQNYTSYWSAPDFINCTDIETIEVSAENAAEVAVQLADITNDELSIEEVSKVVTKVNQLVSVAKINKTLAKTVITILSNVMTSSESALASTSEKALKTVDELVLKIEFDEPSINISSRNLALGILAVDANDFNGTSFSAFIPTNTSNPQVDFESQQASALAEVHLPSSLLTSDSLSGADRSTLSRINFMFFSSTNLFQKEQDGRSLNSYVVASSVGNVSIRELVEPVVIQIAHLSEQPSPNPVCMFWDFSMNGGAGGWNAEGCRVSEESSNNKTICLCNHLTHFGILMDVSGVSPHIDPKNNKILTFITYIGCGISAIFSAATLLTYVAFEKLRRDYPSKILMNLSTSLLFLNMVFLLDGWLASLETRWLCLSVAVLLHYFLLTSFTWMGLESIHMYIALVKVFNTYIRRYILKFCLVGWGLPALLVSIVVAVDKNSYGLQEYGKGGTTEGSSEFCWIKKPAVFYVTCVGYFCLVFLLNVAMFIVVMLQICGRNGKRSNRTIREEVLRNLRSVVSLTFLLGMTWGFALFAWGPVSLPFMYLFAIFNSLQGLFIFIFHCALKENVQKQWRRFFCCGRFRLSDNSDWSKTATNNTKKVSSDNLAKSLSSSSFGSTTNWTSKAKATLNPFTKRHSNTEKCFSNPTSPKCLSSSSSSSTEADPNSSSSSSSSSILPVSQMIDKVKGYCSTRSDNFYKNIILSDGFAHSTRF